MRKFGEFLRAHPVLVLYVVDPLERAGRTFVQQFATILLSGGAGAGALLVTQDWVLALDSSAFAAVVSILTSVLTFKVPKLPDWADVLLRVLKTYLQSFLGTLVAAHVLSISHADWRGALAVGIPTALTSLLTALVSLRVPGTVPGATLLPLPANPNEDALPALSENGSDGEVFADYSGVRDEPLRTNEKQPAPGGELEAHEHIPEHAR